MFDDLRRRRSDRPEEGALDLFAFAAKRRAEDLARKAEEGKRAEEERQAELARQLELQREAELAAQRAEAERQAELERQAERERQAELERQEAERREAERLRQEELERQEAARREAERRRQAEIEREAERKRQEERARRVEAERQAELARQAEAKRLAELEREAELERQAELERLEAAARQEALAQEAERAALAEAEAARQRETEEQELREPEKIVPPIDGPAPEPDTLFEMPAESAGEFPEGEPSRYHPPEQPSQRFRGEAFSPLLKIGRLRQSAAPYKKQLMIGGAVILCVAVLGGLLAASRGKPRAKAPEPKPGAQPAAVAQGKPRETATAKPAAPAKPSVKPALKPAAKPAAPRPAAKSSQFGLDVAGVRVTSDGKEETVYFELGLFSSAAKLSLDGQKALARVGEALKPQAGKVKITVIGCTDNVRLSPKSRFKSNQELGLLRAAEAVRALRAASGIAASDFTTISYGEKWQPYPNDGPVNQARNRTAVLKVAPR